MNGFMRLPLAAVLLVLSPREPSPSSPTEGRIAFASHRDGNWEIYVTNASGAEQTRLTTRADQDRFPLWSPDGSRLAFGSQRDLQPWQLWTMSATGANQVLVCSGIVAKSNREWSADGSTLLITTSSGSASGCGGAAGSGSDIVLVHADGSGARRLTDAPGDDRDASWSPDGNRIVFSSTRNGNSAIYVMGADGSAQQRISRGAADDYSPCWSRDGKTIAFVSERNGSKDLYMMRTDGTGVTRLTTGAVVTRDMSRWSPDGTRIAIQTEAGGNYDIEIVRLADGTRTRVADSPKYDGSFAWSPDGNQLAFISGRDDVDALYVVGRDGGSPKRLTTTGSLTPSWSH